ncbi:hypothetical protein PFISCL1PPCAC_1046, partial [Pristionchus fissidentatus]
VISSMQAPIILPRGSTFHDHFFNQTEKYSNAVALINSTSGEELTFGEIRSKANRLAQCILAMGIEKGEAVLLVMDNRPETIIIFLATSIAGAVTTTINPWWNADELQHQIETSFTRFAFVVPCAIPAVRTCFERIKREHRLICVGPRDHADGLPILSDLELTLELLPQPSLVFPEIIPAEDVAYMPYSSGIHGDRKGILITHEVFCQQIAVANHPFYDNPRQNEYTVSLLPFFRHIGLECAFVGLLNGSTMVCVPDYDVNKYMDVIQRYEIRCVFTTPYMAHQMSRAGPLAPPMDSLKTVIVGTACLTRTVHEAFLDRFPNASIVSMYGMTETGLLARSKPRQSYVKDVGMLVSSVQMKVLDMISGEEVPHGEKGVIYVAGPSTSAPYLDCPEQDPLGGWRKTGDVGSIDEKGYVHLVDRAREIIKVFGVQVIPQELEEILGAHAAVVECAVVGVRDKEAGERPIAYAVLKPLMQVTKDELMEYVNERLCRPKWLLRVELSTTLPRTSCGAILRRVLAEAANLSIDALPTSVAN